MKLKEALKNLTGNVKIGAMGSFFYCGEAAYFIKNADEISFDIKESWKDFGDNSTTKVGRARNFNWYDYIASEARKYRDKGIKPDFTQEGYQKALAYVQKMAEKDLAQAMTYYEEYRDFKHLMAREVKSMYDSELEPDTKIIIITGHECGKFWTVEEEKKWREKKSRGSRVKPSTGMENALEEAV